MLECVDGLVLQRQLPDADCLLVPQLVWVMLTLSPVRKTSERMREWVYEPAADRCCPCHHQRSHSLEQSGERTRWEWRQREMMGMKHSWQWKLDYAVKRKTEEIVVVASVSIQMRTGC